MFKDMASVAIADPVAESGTALSRIIPILVLAQVILYLDRINIGYAALSMNAALSIGSGGFGFVAGVFFIGYALFEVPGNLVAERVGLSRWLVAVMLLWGLVAACTAFSWNTVSLSVWRFLLGVAEGGFLPALFLYIGRFFSETSRGRVMGMLMMGSAFANIIAGPLCTAMLSISGFGLAGWQWLFILQGSPAILLSLAIAVWKLLPERPADAVGLRRGAGAAVSDPVEEEARAQSESSHRASFVAAVKSQAVWVYALTYVCFTVPFGLASWLPQLTQIDFPAASHFQIGVLCVVPYAAGLAVTLFLGRAMDRSGDSRAYLSLIAAGACGCLLLSAFTPATWISFVLLALAVGLIFATPVAFWPAPMAKLSGRAAAGGFAMINSLGALGSFLGPYGFGYLKASTGSAQASLVFISVCAAAAAVIPLRFRDLFTRAGSTNR